MFALSEGVFDAVARAFECLSHLRLVVFPLQFCVSDLRDSYVLPFCGNFNESPGNAILEVIPAVFQESPVSCHVTALATGSFSLFMSISAVELAGTWN